MALPASGQISLSQVNTELALSSTAQIGLNDAAVRSLFGKASGAISMSDGHGKSSAFAAAITSNQTNLNLRTFAVNAGWNQSVPATITVNSNVFVFSNSTGTAGMTIDGNWPGGVTVINNGFVIGMGGAGNGATAGAAISLGVNCTITNNSGAFIGGGGGGANGGGGAGGGAGAGGGSGGGAGAAGSNGVTSGSGSGGASGGRILPGTGGAGGGINGSGGVFAATGGGAGGGGGGSTGQVNIQTFGKNFGGGGGGYGASGGGGLTAFGPFGAVVGANGGAGGAAGGAISGSGGAGGQAIKRNGFTVTTSGAGTTFGAIS